MNEKERKRRPCIACGKPVGTATIIIGEHWGDDPAPPGWNKDAPLCHACFGKDHVEQCAAIAARMRGERSTKSPTGSGGDRG